MPTGNKKSACELVDESTHLVQGSTISNDPNIARCDPAMEHKILSKIVALRERLMVWTRRLDESVYLNEDKQYFMVYIQHTI